VSPVVVFHLAQTGLHAYVAAWFGMLYRRRRDAPEYGLFAALALFVAVATLGTAGLAGARSVAEAASGQRLLYGGVLFACAVFPQLVATLTHDERPWSRTLAGLGAVSGCLAMAGVLVDPSFAGRGYRGGLFDVASAAVTPLGIVAVLGGAFAGLTAVAVLARSAREQPTMRAPLVAAILPMFAGVFDLASRVLGGPSLHVSMTGVSLLIVAMSYVLLRRLVDVDVALERKTRELETAHATLSKAQAELVKKEQLAAVGELSAVIAHEIRNPLAILKNAASGLSRERIAEADRETLLTILDQEADRLNRLVNDLLAYASPLVPDARPVDVVELVELAARLAMESHPRAKEGIRVVVRADQPPSMAWGDPSLLRHALINIVDNAILAMPAGGVVTVTLSDVEERGRPFVSIAFTDEGEGMDTLVRQRARDVFFTTRSTGTGLGLAIVDRVARVHRGRVDIESRHGQGTTVTLYVPRERGSRPPPLG
jgi:signal transduction histidine kinase